MASNSNLLFRRRRRRVRYKLASAKSGRPRLSVHRANKNIYAQIIDDATKSTLASASTLDKELRAKVKNGGDIDAAKAVGALLAERAKKAKVDHVVFDRGGFIYHGRVKALADAAREGGLQF